MIYSCFNAESGHYVYFEADDQIALNADLPVPTFPPAVNGIGVASIEAGRPIPRGAVQIGSGWHARGLVANCNRVGTSGLGQVDGAASKVLSLCIFGVAALGALWLMRRMENAS